jgi:hypothetical protein
MSVFLPSSMVIGPSVVQPPEPPVAAVSAEIAFPPLAGLTEMLARAGLANSKAGKRRNSEHCGLIRSIETKVPR